MYYLNQEVLRSRYHQFTQFNILDQLEPIYQSLKFSLESRDRNTFFQEKVQQQPDCFQVNPIYGFSQQANEIYSSYGQPTQICFYMHRQKRYLMIGTQQSVIICIEVVNGRVESIQAILNAGERQSRYGSVLAIQCWEKYMLVGFERGDIQLYEVGRKWERLHHESKLHSGKVMQVLFIPSSTIEALSLDENGVIYKHAFTVMTVMDKYIVSHSKDKIYKNGKIYHIKRSTQQPKQKQSSWWDNAKSIFKKEEEVNEYIDPSVKHSSDTDGQLTKFALDIKLMPEIMTQQLNQNIQQVVIVAVLYSNRVEILKFYKGSLKCEIVYTLKRNTFSIDLPQQDNTESGELSWGEGYFEKSYQNAKLLCIRWGDIFHLVKCMNIEDELEIVEGAVYKMQKEKGNIIKSSFLTNNIIYAFSDSNWVALIHTTQFQFAKQDDGIVILESKTRMLSKEEIEPQVAEISVSYEGPNIPCQVQIYENGIVSLRKNNILIERLQTWSEYLEDLIEKNQWEKAMHQGMLIYQGQIKILSEIASSLSARQEQMSQMFQKIAFTHIMFALKPLDIPLSQLEKENKIKKTIEFLLRVDNMTYALVVLKDFFKDIQQMKLYFTCLDPFIKNKQIAVIPESFFVDYVNFYQNDKEMIQQLILQLDLHQQEPTLLIKVCMDYHLYKAMIYLCTKQGDFITGLMKLMDLWENKYQSEQKEQCHIEKEKLRKFRIKLGYNILAYVRMCVKGINILGERVPHNIYFDMLRGLVSFIFNTENLKLFILIDIRLSLQLLLQFMQHHIYTNIKLVTLPEIKFQIINHVPEILKLMLSSIENTREDIKIQEHYQLIYNEKTQQYHQINLTEQLNYFLLFYSELLIQFPLQFTKQFKEKLFLDLLSPSYFETLKQYNYNNQETDPIYLESYEVNKNAYLIHMYDTSQINDISLVFNGSIPYPEFHAFLIYKQNDYITCISNYFQMQNSMMKRNVFEVIERLLMYSNSQLLMQLQEFIIENCNTLMNISQQYTNRIFKEYFHDLKLQMQIIQKLEKTPENQLHYLKQYIKNEKASDSIRLLYLELLCQRSPKEVLKNVQNGDFPLDDAMAICEKYKVYNAAAYLLQKNGAIQKALDMLTLLFINRLKDCHKSFARSKTISEIDQEEIFEKLNYIIDLCSKIEDDGYWFQFLDSFFKQHKLEQLTDLKVPESLRKLHGDIVSEVFLAMSKCIELDRLLNKMNQHYGSIPLRVFLKTNKSIQEKFAFELPSYNIAMQQTDITYKTLNQKLFQQMNQGVCVDRFCGECNDRITKCTKAVAFQCGHSYHQECYIELHGNNQKSFNSLKLKNQKVFQECFICLDNNEKYISHLIVQASLKRLKFDFDKYLHKQANVVPESKQVIVQYDKIEQREKAIKKLKQDDFNKLYIRESSLNWKNW
ncbi:unnamed protein product [Paramecium pentaurelia]|uniref:Vacuolar protein sorting-associated protein 8 central domain-containing protein n=1 Tax=Paramecium pentaurelia TaxID=43138 RepID=A0A8S1YEK4_9CILI|nr:unnamed protein product [Paramecium pentaurelia]